MSTIQPLVAPRSVAGTRRRLHVAIVNEEIPFPPTSGGRIRPHNLLRRLAGRHRITYLCHRHADPAEGQAAIDWARSLGVETVVVDRPLPGKSGLGFYARLAANLFSTQPYSVATHNSRALRATLAHFAAHHPVDLWQCDWAPYFAPLSAVPAARAIVMAANVESQIWQRYWENETHPLKRWYIKQQWQKFLRFERRAFTQAARLITVSQEDARLAERQFGARQVAVVDNGVDTDFFLPRDEPRDPRTILFVGSLDWRPNQDACRVMLEEVFPRVRAQEPAARLWIVGRQPPDWLVNAASQQAGVELFADVPDVRPYLAQAGVMAVSLRIGGGSRLKILEALAMRTPVVSTKIGAEGLHLQPGDHLEVVDGIEPLADALIRAVRQPEAMQAQARRGREVMLEHYDWEILADKLETISYECSNLAS